jgi:hypothetical protein
VLSNPQGDQRTARVSSGPTHELFSFKNTDQLKALFDHYRATEATAGELVSNLLRDLARLSDEVDIRKDYVLTELETAKDIIHDCRKKFIDLEIKINDAL